MSSNAVIYVQGQSELATPWTDVDQAKLDLARFMNQARGTILMRVNSLPGSGASTELWLRYRQIEDAAQALGNQGLWVRALAQFKQAYTTLLTAAPTGNAEKIGYGSRGTRGVGHADCPGKCANCVGCLACAGRRAVDDFVSLMRRFYAANTSGDLVEAGKMFDRAKAVAIKLEPDDAKAAQVDLDAASRKFDVAATQKGVGRVRGVRDMASDQQQLAGFRSASNAARAYYGRGDIGNGDGALQVAMQLYANPYVQNQAAGELAYTQQIRATAVGQGAGTVVTDSQGMSASAGEDYANQERTRASVQANARPDSVWDAQKQGFKEGLQEGFDNLKKAGAALTSGSLLPAWNLLPAVGKVVVVAGTAFMGVKVAKAVRG